MSSFKRKVNIIESTTPPSNTYDWWYDLNKKVLKKPVNGAYVSISNGDPSNSIEEENAHAGVLYSGSSEGSESDIVHMCLYDHAEIPIHAFNRRTDITSVIVLDGTKVISNGAFIHCSNLSNIRLPNSIISLGNQAFAFCTSLSSLHLPNSLEEIKRPFPVEKECSLSTITGKYTVDNIFVVKDNSLYYTCPATYSETDIWSGKVVSIPQVETLKEYSVSMTRYYEEDDYDDEGNNIINYYGANVELPDSLQHIEDHAFGYGCTGISSISGKYSRDGIFVIKDGKLYVVAGCLSYDATDITIPNDVTVISSYTIYGHHTVSNIYLYDSVKTIQPFGFTIGREINIYINNTIPPTLEAESGISRYATIYVPSSAVDTYKTATNWSAHADRIIGYDFN